LGIAALAGKLHFILDWLKILGLGVGRVGLVWLWTTRSSLPCFGDRSGSFSFSMIDIGISFRFVSEI
jgi:hypothetical protein